MVSALDGKYIYTASVIKYSVIFLPLLRWLAICNYLYLKRLYNRNVYDYKSTL